MAFAAPAVGFGLAGGLLGGLCGVVAAIGAVAVAKRSPSTVVKIGAAISLYGIAAVAWLVLATVIHVKR
jgi:hypothetical protein